MRLLALIFLTTAVGSCSPSVVLKSELDLDRVKGRPVERPGRCAHLRRTYTEDEWDPVREEYPENVEWNECMGVGRK